MPGRINRDERIGEKLLRHRIIDTYHLNNVLIRQQHGDRRRFGDIAVDLGYIARNTVEGCLQTSGTDLYDNQDKDEPNQKKKLSSIKRASQKKAE
ncbi:MAG: hypothetical protein JXB03_13140 [Spirochaetales bacterium]|nr:hypothetical protein [Spirochaetales bacterium]